MAQQPIRNFGSVTKISGQPPGLNTGQGTGGNAGTGDVLATKTFTNDNGEQTGQMVNKVGSATIITPSTSDQTIAQGYYGGAAGDGKVSGSANLIAGNIANGITIFGVTGNVAGLKYATGTKSCTWAVSGTTNQTVNGLGFTPIFVAIRVHYDQFDYAIPYNGWYYNSSCFGYKYGGVDITAPMVSNNDQGYMAYQSYFNVVCETFYFASGEFRISTASTTGALKTGGVDWYAVGV